MIISIEIMVGLIFVVLGFSILLHEKNWQALARRIIDRENQNALLAVGGINLLLGAFILAFHWVWYGLGMIVTLIGVLLFLRGCCTLLFPGYIQNLFPKFEPRLYAMIRFGGIAAVILGLLSFAAAWM
jgi:uncharacterized protein YjeT (DUF2065 family)